MDGDRLTYVSGGKLAVLDYDGNNLQELMPSNPAYIPNFSPDYKYVYNITSPGAKAQLNLAQTSLLVPTDQ